MEAGYKLRRTDRGWQQWEVACITDRDVELISKRNELIDALSEERESTPEEKRPIAQQAADSKTTKFFLRQGRDRELVSANGTGALGLNNARSSKEGINSNCQSIREMAVEADFAKHS